MLSYLLGSLSHYGQASRRCDLQPEPGGLDSAPVSAARGERRPPGLTPGPPSAKRTHGRRYGRAYKSSAIQAFLGYRVREGPQTRGDIDRRGWVKPRNCGHQSTIHRERLGPPGDRPPGQPSRGVRADARKQERPRRPRGLLSNPPLSSWSLKRLSGTRSPAQLMKCETRPRDPEVGDRPLEEIQRAPHFPSSWRVIGW